MEISSERVPMEEAARLLMAAKRPKILDLNTSIRGVKAAEHKQQ
jgi:hypothetical protein